MKDLTMFDFSGQSVRVITDDDGDPWFVVRDIADILGYSNPSKAIQDHCKKSNPLKLLNNNDSLWLLKIIQMDGLRSDTLVVPETDVYRLVMRSKLESAERFQDWVVEDVLPSIRKTGGYQVAPDPMLSLSDPTVLRSMLLSYSEAVIAKDAQIAVLAPQAAALKQISGADGSQCITDVAKAITRTMARTLITDCHPKNHVDLAGAPR